MGLSPTAKHLWNYLLDHCDNAGVVQPNTKLAAFQIGEPIEEKHFAELGDRLQPMADGKLWIPSFIKFQFGTLKEVNGIHKSVIRTIQAHNLTYPIPCESHGQGTRVGRQSPQVIDKDKKKDKKEGEYEGKPTLEEVTLFVSGLRLPVSDAVWFWNKEEANGWTNGGRKIKSWKHTVSSWKAAGYMPSQKTSSNGHQPSQLTLLQKIMNEIPG